MGMAVWVDDSQRFKYSWLLFFMQVIDITEGQDSFFQRRPKASWTVVAQIMLDGSWGGLMLKSSFLSFYSFIYLFIYVYIFLRNIELQQVQDPLVQRRPACGHAVGREPDISRRNSQVSGWHHSSDWNRTPTRAAIPDKTCSHRDSHPQPLLCVDWHSNFLPFINVGCGQKTEPHNSFSQHLTGRGENVSTVTSIFAASACNKYYPEWRKGCHIVCVLQFGYTYSGQCEKDLRLFVCIWFHSGVARCVDPPESNCVIQVTFRSCFTQSQRWSWKRRSVWWREYQISVMIRVGRSVMPGNCDQGVVIATKNSSLATKLFTFVTGDLPFSRTLTAWFLRLL